MEELKKFFINNSAQIWILISVAFGGFVTYISTSAAEKRKNKQQAQKEKMTQILIPYCTCLEETISTAKEIYNFDGFYNVSFYDKWIYELRKPFEYLNAAKRVFLSEKSRATLQRYKACLDDFEIIIEKECNKCLIKYKEYIEKAIIDFPNISNSMFIQFSMSDISALKLKFAIITKTPLSLVDDFTCVDFIHNDDPDNYCNTSIHLNEEAYTTLGMIDSGVIDIDEVDDPNIELACILLDYIAETTSDEKDILTSIIDETTGADLFRELVEILESTRNILIKEIDSISQ